MRLTKGLQAVLVNALIEDQFKDEFEQIEKRFKSAVLSAVPTDLIDDSNTLLRVQQTLNNPNILNQLLTQTVDAGLTWDSFPSKKKIQAEGRNPHYIFELARYVNNEQRQYVVSRYETRVQLKSPDAAIKACLDEYRDFVAKVKQTQKEAVEVLANIPTVKKLREVTKVFDPFLPSDVIAGTALIPVDSLVAINKLKTPKAKKKAA